MSWTATRRAILERDDYTCQYCFHRPKFLQRRGYLGWRGTLHVDHVYPRSRGGTNHPRNLVTACESCNLEKHANVWVPARVYCFWCGRAHTDHDPDTVRIDKRGVRWECPNCVVAIEDAELPVRPDAVGYYLDDLDDVELEQRYYDQLIAQGWDVAA